MASAAYLSVANVALRGVTMLGRFVLIGALAIYLEPADVGLFALFSAAAVWGVYLQGLEFHLHNLREVVAADHATWARRTRDAFALYGVVFGGAFVVWVVLFGVGLLPWSVFGWFLVILAVEHVAQEAYRLLTVFGRPIAGSLVLFARTGGWSYAVVVVMYVAPSLRSLETVLLGWSIGAGLGVMLALWFVRDLPWRGLPPIDWRWIRVGLGVALPLLIGSLSLRGMPLFDRWLVGHVHGEHALGVFGLFAAIAGAVPILADSGVGSVLYPKMMKAYRLDDLAAYRRHRLRLFVAFAAVVVVAVPAALLAVTWLVARLPQYAPDLATFHVLIAAAAIATIGAAPQYVLWARGNDRTIIAISVIGLVALVTLDLVLVPWHGVIGAAWGQVGAMTLVLLLRVAAVARGAGSAS